MSSKFTVRTIILACFIGLATGFYACKEGKVHSHSCNYYGSADYTEVLTDIETGKYNFSSNGQADKIVTDIVNHVGLQRNFTIVSDNSVPNAAAAVINNERYILYNNAFMEMANNLTSSDWSSISILAHEIGHHLQGHTLTADGSRPNLELEADKFSGFVLAKMGASLEDAQKALQVLVSESGSATHPSRAQRLTAVAEGFNQAHKLSRNEKPTENATKSTGSSAQTNNSSTVMTEEEYIDMPERYGVELIQTGGEGSRQVQVIAFYLEEHGYMDNAESKACYFFNSPASILWICNPPGFKVESVEYIDGEDTLPAEFSDGNYYVYIQNKIQNKIIVYYTKTTLSEFLIEIN